MLDLEPIKKRIEAGYQRRWIEPGYTDETGMTFPDRHLRAREFGKAIADVAALFAEVERLRIENEIWVPRPKVNSASTTAQNYQK